MSRYTNCWVCNRRLNEGDLVVSDKSYVGVFCSPACWAERHGTFKRVVLDDNFIENDGAVTFKEYK